VSKASRTRRLEGAHLRDAADILAMSRKAESDVQEMATMTNLMFGIPRGRRQKMPGDRLPSGRSMTPAPAFHLL
jgi:hypothetical protein